MKRKDFWKGCYLIGILSIVFCFSTSAAQWQLVSEVVLSDGGVTSGWINQILIDPAKSGVFYVATEDAGVLVSNDGGNSWLKRWAPKLVGLTADSAEWVSGYRVKCLAIDPVKPSVMYAGMDKLGVFRSDDAGVSWSEMNEMLMDSYIRAIAIHPSRPDVLYLGTYGGGVYQRAAESSGWQEIIQGMRNTYVTALVMAAGNPDVIYAATNGGISKTTDGGRNWVSVNNGLTTGYMLCLAIDPGNAEVLYAGSDGQGLFKTENGGENWVSLGGDIWMTEILPGNMAPVVSNVVVNPVNTEIIYAANSSGVFRSADGGQNWNRLDAGLTSTNIKSLTVTGKAPVVVYTGTADSKIFSYTEE